MNISNIKIIQIYINLHCHNARYFFVIRFIFNIFNFCSLIVATNMFHSMIIIYQFILLFVLLFFRYGNVLDYFGSTDPANVSFPGMLNLLLNIIFNHTFFECM